MLEKLQDKLSKHIHKDYAYLIICAIYLLSVYVPLLAVGYIFDIIPFILISSIIMNNIRKYSGGLHMSSNGKCLILSSILLIVFGYIAKQTVNNLQFAFFISILSIKDLYEKAPLFIEDTLLEFRWYNCKPYTHIWKLFKINTTKYDKPYDRVWYRKGMIKWIVISLILSVITLYFEQYYYTSCILWSIIMCDALLYKNQDEFL